VAASIGPAIRVALADQLREALVPVLGDMQVEPKLVWRPTPPTLDVLGGDTQVAAIAFGDAEVDLHYTIRARVGTPDVDAALDLLDELRDPVGDGSVVLAVAADSTLGGACSQCVVVEGPTGDQVFPATDGAGDLLGCLWTVTVTP
jgi:hypothetical protein